MPLTRNEVGQMSDTILQVVLDGCVHRLRSEWADGRPGKLSDVYDLALLHTETVIRGTQAGGPLPAPLFTGLNDQAA